MATAFPSFSCAAVNSARAMPKSKAPSFKPYDMPDEALQWATQQGFMSLEVDEVPLSTFAGMPLDNDGEADEAEARPKKKSKKEKKAQKALSSEADARAMATEPDEAEADGGDKAAKR